MDNAFFFDSYAIVEILRGNASYAKYRASALVTTKLNLFEVYYAILREASEKEADAFLDKYHPLAIDFDKTVISEAAQMRWHLKSRKLSMTDCIGYVLALRLNIPFLTGDKEFEKLPNTEFVR